MPARAKKLPHHQRVHAQRRAKQRYGVELSTRQIKEMARLIRASSDEAELIAKQSLSRKLYRVRYEGNTYNVIYDKKRSTVVTFLTDVMVADLLGIMMEQGCPI